MAEVWEPLVSEGDQLGVDGLGWLEGNEAVEGGFVGR